MQPTYDPVGNRDRETPSDRGADDPQVEPARVHVARELLGNDAYADKASDERAIWLKVQTACG